MAGVAGTGAPRRRLTGVGRSRPSGGVFERSLAWEGVRATSKASGRLGEQEQGPGVQRNGKGGTGSPACHDNAVPSPI